jgi:Uma2 family endonuclease
MSTQPLPRMTPEQYLAMERAAEFKSEYFERMYPMPGGAIPHARRLRVSAQGLCTYPDVTVVCGEARFAVIVEVLSKSTEGHDRGFKFAQYRKLDSLRSYALVSPSEPRVETFHPQADGRWVLPESVGMDAVCRFESLDFQILLSDIYDRVTLGEEPASAPG